jgi:hypothetical protein
VHKWLRRFAEAGEAGEAGLADRSCRPHRSPVVLALVCGFGSVCGACWSAGVPPKPLALLASTLVV